MEADRRGRPRPETDDRHERRVGRLASSRGRIGLGESHELDEPAAPEPSFDVHHLEVAQAPESGTSPEMDPGPDEEQSFRELRPKLKLRIWQIIPIVALGVLGSLMFAFPLAFDSGGDERPAVVIVGLLFSCCAAGWGIMAARRVGYTWPGLPVRGSGRGSDWRVVAGYAVFAALVGILAVVRVARLR